MKYSILAETYEKLEKEPGKIKKTVYAPRISPVINIEVKVISAI